MDLTRNWIILELEISDSGEACSLLFWGAGMRYGQEGVTWYEVGGWGITPQWSCGGSWFSEGTAFRFMIL